jgi:pyruvate formate lyase activating enzyme
LLPFTTATCHGPLEPVKRTIETAARVCHVELTTLLIPGLNDDEDEIDQLARWVASIDRLIPLPLPRHHPAYHMTQPGPISIDRLPLLAKIARRPLSESFLAISEPGQDSREGGEASIAASLRQRLITAADNSD